MKRRLLLLSPMLFVACNFDHSLGSSEPDASAGVGADAVQTTPPPPPDETKPPSPDAASPISVDTATPSAPDAPLSSGGGSLPCDVVATTWNGVRCVSAHSTVRVIVSGYSGPLYQLCKGPSNPGPGACQGGTLDVMAMAGYADIATHDAYCADAACTISKIYDQSGQGNHLEPAPKGGAKPTPDNPAQASALPVSINGHNAYGVLIKAGMGYRTGCDGCTLKKSNGMPLGDEPQTVYMVTSQKDLVNGCCFDYGNAETTSNDEGNGTAESVYFGGGVVWGTGSGGRAAAFTNTPWVMADLENGLYAGWENRQDQDISTNKPLRFDFVTAVLVGDTKEKNNGKGRFALYGADAQGKDPTFGKLTTMYDGIRPEKPGYVPMQKQGSLVLGTAGDNSSGGGGRFYEGAVIAGPALDTSTLAALQASIVAAGYGSETVVPLPVDAGTPVDAPAPAVPDAPIAQAPDAPVAPTPDAQITSGGATQSWTGYVENYQFPSGSDRIKLVFTADASGKVTGTVTFGNVPAPPPATDPNVGYPVGMRFNDLYTNKALEGTAFTIRNGSLQSYRLRFTVETNELWASWCALQTPPSDGSTGCLPPWPQGYSGYDDGYNSCGYLPYGNYNYNQDAGSDAAPAGLIAVDCGKWDLCRRETCTCSPSGCTLSPIDEYDNYHFKSSFDVFLANGTGSGSVTGFTERNVHLIKD